MGCGCGKKSVARQRPPTTMVPRRLGSTTSTDVAKIYQSATMLKAPTGPVTTRKTV